MVKPFNCRSLSGKPDGIHGLKNVGFKKGKMPIPRFIEGYPVSIPVVGASLGAGLDYWLDDIQNPLDSRLRTWQNYPSTTSM